MIFQFLQNMRDTLLKLLRKRLADLKAREQVLFINSHWHGKSGKYARDLARLQRRIRSLQKKIEKCERKR